MKTLESPDPLARILIERAAGAIASNVGALKRVGETLARIGNDAMGPCDHGPVPFSKPLALVPFNLGVALVPFNLGVAVVGCFRAGCLDVGCFVSGCCHVDEITWRLDVSVMDA